MEALEREGGGDWGLGEGWGVAGGGDAGGGDLVAGARALGLRGPCVEILWRLVAEVMY